jgi:hypothetical protein
MEEACGHEVPEALQGTEEIMREKEHGTCVSPV